MEWREAADMLLDKERDTDAADFSWDCKISPSQKGSHVNMFVFSALTDIL